MARHVDRAVQSVVQLLGNAFYRMVRCPVCKAQPSTGRGCCESCAAAMFQAGLEAGVLALGNYEGRLERAVRALKFHGVTRLAPLFGRHLADAVLGTRWPVEMVCAVPLHRGRRLARGYNQSALIARAAARQLGLPYRPVLRRVRATRQQALLSPSERHRNVAGAFRCRPVEGSRVLLVDDVVTTGATTLECSLALLEAGAAAVHVAAVARAGTATGRKPRP